MTGPSGFSHHTAQQITVLLPFVLATGTGIGILIANTDQCHSPLSCR